MDNNYYNNEEVMSVGSWVGVLIVLAIPLVNIIMYLVWAFSTNTNRNLSNFCKATLLLGLIGFGIAFLFSACTSALLLGY